MKLKKLYEEVSLCYGLAMTIVVTAFLGLDKLDHCIIITEPNPWIRIPEVILGIISIPYFVKKIYKDLR